MRVDTIELLRCPATHESAPLVTVADTRDGERLTSGTLGCPVCGTDYAMRNGIVYLTSATTNVALLQRASAITSSNGMRTAALLGLTEPGLRVVLCGAHAVGADEIEHATGAHCIAVNSRAHMHESSGADQLVMLASDSLPLANASVHGLALDITHAALLADARRVVRVGGRVVAPVSIRVPRGLRELARDDREWVAQVEAAPSAPMQLTRR